MLLRYVYLHCRICQRHLTQAVFETTIFETLGIRGRTESLIWCRLAKLLYYIYIYSMMLMPLRHVLFKSITKDHHLYRLVYHIFLYCCSKTRPLLMTFIKWLGATIWLLYILVVVVVVVHA